VLLGGIIVLPGTIPVWKTKPEFRVSALKGVDLCSLVNKITRKG